VSICQFRSWLSGRLQIITVHFVFSQGQIIHEGLHGGSGPDGADQKLHQGFGFVSRPDHEQAMGKAHGELAKLFSSAFLSRLGRPVLFRPLGRKAQVEILRRALSKSLGRGLERIGGRGIRVDLDDDLPAAVWEGQLGGGQSHGARGIMDLARSLSAQALLRLDSPQLKAATEFTARFDEKGGLYLIPKMKERQ
jgi:ATP-dependent Clp protease ATP-binding subunit ClpA